MEDAYDSQCAVAALGCSHDGLCTAVDNGTRRAKLFTVLCAVWVTLLLDLRNCCVDVSCRGKPGQRVRAGAHGTLLSLHVRICACTGSGTAV